MLSVVPARTAVVGVRSLQLNRVQDWFGPAFSQLHPLIQQLHRDGGELQGKVTLSFGSGLAQLLGVRLAKKMGLPLQPGEYDFSVAISHDDEALVWARTFNHANTMVSRFTPVGQYPDGYFVEKTGPIELRRRVDIVQGGWYWRQLATRLHGIWMPGFLLPQTNAYKTIDNDRYVFEVSTRYPLFGKLLEYKGILHITG